MTSVVSKFAPAPMGREAATHTAIYLQTLLFSEIDLYLTLKQAHWNVIGPAFIGVHELLDRGAKMAREMGDGTAERIAALGAAPVGTPGALVEARRHADYPLLKADTQIHLTAVDNVLSDVGAQLREAIKDCATLDLVTQNLLLGHAEELEQYQWLIRAHLEVGNGVLPGTV